MTNLYDGIATEQSLAETSSGIPGYLQNSYWWAYIHPRGVRVFERQWLVSLILWGNYRRLCNAVLQAYGANISGATLQIACAYGDLTPRLAEQMGAAGTLDVIDILPIQLSNLAQKLAPDNVVKLHCMDSTALAFPSRQFDRALLFFLLHEQPLDVRRQTLAEALRVVRAGGMLTIVDYAKPAWFNPLRYIMAPILSWLEPYARDLWQSDIASWLPQNANIEIVSKHRYFGGLYQLLTLKIN